MTTANQLIKTFKVQDGSYSIPILIIFPKGRYIKIKVFTADKSQIKGYHRLIIVLPGFREKL